MGYTIMIFFGNYPKSLVFDHVQNINTAVAAVIIDNQEFRVGKIVYFV